MSKLIFVIFLSLIPMTACSSESELKYDPIEMQVWQSCIDAFLEENAGFYSSNEILMDRAIEACQKFTPRKK
jgi:hypothetical protein